MDTIINISGKLLSERYTDVLLKGPSFTPTYSTRELDTKMDIHRFHRHLHLKAW